MIQELTATPELNKTYMGKVQRITDFGAFVEIMAGTDGLLHVSEIANYRVKDVRDELKEGQPIIAAVHGRAVGIGTMLLHCDLVLLADDAQLSTPFVNLALVPEAASSLLLPARIGHVRAFAMFVLGEAIDASTAVAWGLANAVVPLDQLRAHARAVAGRVAERPPASVRHTKRLMHDAETLSARMAEENRLIAAQLKSAEAREAFAAFRDKRPPDFTRVRA
jgi:enoyl-CoA hydratase/carnithine racemase